MGAAAVAAAIAGWWMPRGPVSSGQALATMAIGLAVSLVAGAALRSRWALLLAPAVFAGVIEVVRIDAVGPTAYGACEPSSTLTRSGMTVSPTYRRPPYASCPSVCPRGHQRHMRGVAGGGDELLDAVGWRRTSR